MGNSLNDGLSKPNQLADQAVDSPEQAFVGTGSPTVFGNAIQFGTVEPSGAASIVSFGTAFKGVPQVVISIAESGTGNVSVTGASAGSFTFLGTSGLGYNWIACGSGDI